MQLDTVQPEDWKAPSGYANGMRVRGNGDLLFVAGQIAWDANQQLVAPDDFVGQFRQALANVVEVVRAGGGSPEHLVQLTIYVTDKRRYLQATREIGAIYRETVGRHFPAMALLEVAGLLEEGAMVEIQAIAALP